VVAWLIAAQEKLHIGPIPVERLDLSKNFRSQASLVEWVNGVFPTVLGGISDPGRGAVKFAPAVAAHPRVPGVDATLDLCASAEQEAALSADPRRTLNQLLFPGPTKEFEDSRDRFGNLSVLGTIEFLHGLEQGSEYEAEIEAGKRLLLGISSVGDADRHGMRTVMCTLNGQFRPIQVRDRSITADIKAVGKADPTRAGHVPAPFSGVVTPSVAEGDTVEAGGVVATIEAMKMEANITSPVGGTVQRLAFSGHHQQVEGGDLIVVVTPA